MPYGLQVFGPDGTLWVDTSSQLGRIYGQAVTLGPGNSSVNLPQLAGQGTPFAILPVPAEQSASTQGLEFRAPIVGSLSFSGTQLSVQFMFANYSNPYVSAFYGVF